MQQFKTGDKVKWNSIHGPVTGKIVKEITKPTKVKGFTAKPTTEKEYLVKSETGNEAIHKISALTSV